MAQPVSAGDAGMRLLDDTGRPLRMSAAIIKTQCEAIGVEDQQQPIIFGTADANNTTLFFAALLTKKRIAHRPHFIVVKDPAPESNPVLGCFLAPWPANITEFDMENVTECIFVARTRNVLVAAITFQKDQEIAQLRDQLRTQQPDRQQAAGPAANASTSTRRPIQPAVTYGTVDWWAPAIAEHGPDHLLSMLYVRLCPGTGKTQYHREAWAAVENSVYTIAEFLACGQPVPPRAWLVAQAAADQMVLAAGAFTGKEYAAMKAAWAAKAEGPAGIVASFSRRGGRGAFGGGGGGGRGRGGRGGSGGSGAGNCYFCGKSGHKQPDCPAYLDAATKAKK